MKTINHNGKALYCDCEYGADEDLILIECVNRDYNSDETEAVLKHYRSVLKKDGTVDKRKLHHAKRGGGRQKNETIYGEPTVQYRNFIVPKSRLAEFSALLNDYANALLFRYRVSN